MDFSLDGDYFCAGSMSSARNDIQCYAFKNKKWIPAKSNIKGKGLFFGDKLTLSDDLKHMFFVRNNIPTILTFQKEAWIEIPIENILLKSDFFSHNIDMSPNAELLALTDPEIRNKNGSTGKIYFFEKKEATYQLIETFENQDKNYSLGWNMKFAGDAKSFIASGSGNIKVYKIKK